MIKPINVKGTRDFSPIEVKKRNYIIDIIKKHFELFGFAEIQTPSLENINTLTGKYGNEGDKLIFKIINSGDYLKKVTEEELNNRDLKSIEKKIIDKGLRYDLTVPFARYFAKNRNEITLPFKRFQIQPVWRADRPQKGRFREFFQCDADVIGTNSILQEIELISIYQNVFKDLGINVSIKLNNRKILIGILEVIGKKDLFMEFTTILDKVDKIGIYKAIEELEGLGIKEDIVKNILLSKDLEELKENLKKSKEGLKGIEELEFLLKNVDKNNVYFDITLARGLDYYTGTILEVISKDIEIGSIGGGGRYDDLVEVFGIKDISGVGISFGLDRIYIVLEEMGLFPKSIKNSVDVLFINFGEQEIRECLYISKELRKNNISCEIYPTTAKIKKQMEYANKRGAKFVIIIGEEEIVRGEATIKKYGKWRAKYYKIRKYYILY